MSNVIPREAQQTVQRMFYARFIIAAALLGLFVAGLCALALLPSYLALHSGGDVGVASSTISKTTNIEDRDAIARARALLVTLSPLFTATSTSAHMIEQALLLRPSTISIDHISYTGGNQGTIVLGGVAATREAISGYRQALAANTQFKSVSVPIGDLTGAPGGRFSLTLSGDF